MKFGSKIKGVLCGFLSLTLVSVAVVCVYFRLGDFNITGDDAVLMAAALTMSKGSYFTATEPGDNNKATENKKETVPVETAPKTEKIKFSSDYYNTYGKHKNQKKKMAQIQEKSSSDAINYWISFVINWQTRVIS